MFYNCRVYFWVVEFGSVCNVTFRCDIVRNWEMERQIMGSEIGFGD